jgi:protein-S-isoprenylcysteine O-methyltransferase Ste14
MLKPPTLLLLFLVALPATHASIPWVTVVRWPWNLIGLAGILAGVVLNVVADALFKRHGSPRACQGPAILLVRGPYGWSRNPMYLGFVLILVGVGVVLGSLTPLLLAAAFVPLVERRFVRREEATLAERHRDAWDDYAARVRRWV